MPRKGNHFEGNMAILAGNFDFFLAVKNPRHPAGLGKQVFRAYVMDGFSAPDKLGLNLREFHEIGLPF